MAAAWWLLGVCDGGSRVEEEREGAHEKGAEREREAGDGESGCGYFRLNFLI